jgi:hypothetical protein
MSTFEFCDAIVTASDDDPDTFVFAPRKPDLALDENGRRQLNLLNAGPVSFLQVTGMWGLSAPKLDALRGELARKLGRNPATLRLRPQADTVRNVELRLGEGADAVVLGTSTSSGVPPYHAAFSVMLDDPKRINRVKEALEGKERQLVLRYDIARPRSTSEITTFSVELDAAHWIQ